VSEPPAGPAGRLVDEVVPPVDAATVLLVRDRPSRSAEPDPGADLEVLLLERHLDSDFAGGALVFPGGKVAAADRELPPDRWTGSPLERWREPLGVTTDDDALGLLVAAVRETFEEVGVLLAARDDGAPIRAHDLASGSFVEMRERLASRGLDQDWRGWLEQQRLVLDLDALALWSWWVTPEGQHKRFDTRFFIAAAPADQIAEHDAVEATGVTWVRPLDVLEAQERGEVTIIFPTRRNLKGLAAFGTAAEALAAAREGRVDQRRIVPRVVRVDGRVMVQHPFEDAPEHI
jgi:8-oxo-dGTP pyrophosphatase MutT (NUDIX family)